MAKLKPFHGTIIAYGLPGMSKHQQQVVVGVGATSVSAASEAFLALGYVIYKNEITRYWSKMGLPEHIDALLQNPLVPMYKPGARFSSDKEPWLVMPPRPGSSMARRNK